MSIYLGIVGHGRWRPSALPAPNQASISNQIGRFCKQRRSMGQLSHLCYHELTLAGSSLSNGMRSMETSRPTSNPSDMIRLICRWPMVPAFSRECGTGLNTAQSTTAGVRCVCTTAADKVTYTA